MGNVLAGVSVSVWWRLWWLVDMRGGGGGGSLIVWSVSMPAPHSHPAAVERGGKDINRPSGIRPHSEE